MRVVIIESKDSDTNLGERIRAAVEGKILPLELETAYVRFFYQMPDAVDPTADMNIALLFPRKEYGPIAAEVFRTLVERGAKVFFEWYEDIAASEEDIIKEVVRIISG